MRLKTIALSLLAVLSVAAFPLHAADSGDELPMNPDVLYGELPCGTRYYIYRSLRPAYKTNFYLLNNIGSVLEEEDERGFAHFVEHLAFNGTKNFPDRQIVDILERHGVRFGYDVNAYTSFDATTYNISSVDMSQGDEMIDTCLLMLKDIACNITLSDSAIERERKIIYEEWRQGSTAAERYMQKALPVLFGPDCRYGSRLPIGLPDVLLSFEPSHLRDFHRKWYQPQHQAIVVVGYVIPRDVEKAIRRIWKDVRAPKNPTSRHWDSVPDHSGIKALAYTDTEYPGSQIDLWWKIDIPPRGERNTRRYMADCFLASIASNVMKARLWSASNEPESPFSGATADYDQYYSADSRDAFRLYALYDVRDRDRALARLVTEAKRAAVYGATHSELENALLSLRRSASRLPEEFSEKNNDGVFEAVSEHFLKANPLPPLDIQQEVMLGFCDSLSLSTVSSFLSRTLRPDNLTVLIAEKSSFSSDSLTAGLAGKVDSLWSAAEVAPADDESELLSRPILPVLPEPGSVVERIELGPFPAVGYRFSNGTCAIACTSDVVSDEIALRAIRIGGHSRLLSHGFAEAMLTDKVSELGGLGSFSATELAKRLQATKIDMSTDFYPYFEVISAGCGADEIETMLSLVHLRMTDVKADSVAFANWKKASIGAVSDVLRTPEGQLGMTIQDTFYGKDNLMKRIPVVADIDTLDYAKALRIARSRIADPTAYLFIITGDFVPDSIAPLLARYIGSLPAPATRDRDEISPRGGRALPGERVVEFTIDSPTASDAVQMFLEVDRTYSVRDNMTLEVLAGILETGLIKALRTEKGATYSPEVTPASDEIDDVHLLSIGFNCAPGTGLGLSEVVMDELRKIATDGPDPDLFASIRSYLVEEKTVETLQQDYPMEYFTRLAICGNANLADEVPEMQAVTASDVREMAMAMLYSCASAVVVMHSVPAAR